MKRKWFRKILGGLSLTTAVFIFQACYGTPQDFGNDLLLEGRVRSTESGDPIEGIKVLIENTSQYELTDEQGNFSFYTQARDSILVQFQDVDSIQSGLFVDKDTTLVNVYDKVFLEINMDNK